MSAAKSKSSTTFKPKSKYPNDAAQSTWITLTRQGDKAVFSKIVAKYQGPVYNLCYRMLGNAAEAEDATQEIFLRAYAKLDSYDDRHQFSSWLFSIASHYCIDKLRSFRPVLVSWDSLKYYWPAGNTTQPEKALLKVEATEEVYALLKTLSPDYRGIIIMRYWYALSYRDIAETLGTTVSAIKSKLFRARKMMAQTALLQQQRAAISSSQILPTMGY